VTGWRKFLAAPKVAGTYFYGSSKAHSAGIPQPDFVNLRGRRKMATRSCFQCQGSIASKPVRYRAARFCTRGCLTEFLRKLRRKVKRPRVARAPRAEFPDAPALALPPGNPAPHAWPSLSPDLAQPGAVS
jgi:hypothetical protein